MMHATIPEKYDFEKSVDDSAVSLVVLKNSNGIQAAITNYGARWVSLLTPDKRGTFTDVIVGFDSLDGYLSSSEFYYGATVGRCANRIRNGEFRLEEKLYTLTKNRGFGHLHGGLKGFHAVVWAFEKVSASSTTLYYLSKDGEEGYPGNLEVRVTFTLTEANDFQIHFWAQTDKVTIVNLTNHAFFNLNGQGRSDILHHSLYINADSYTPMDEDSIPFGTTEPVEETPFDFRKASPIGAGIDIDNLQLKNGNGYDHNFVLSKTSNDITLAATAIGDESGIRMDVYTTEPGLQFYTGNFMNGNNMIKGGTKDNYRTAFCLETQHFPDAPNHAAFPTSVLHPGKTYSTTSIFSFSVASA